MTLDRESILRSSALRLVKNLPVLPPCRGGNMLAQGKVALAITALGFDAKKTIAG